MRVSTKEDNKKLLRVKRFSLQKHKLSFIIYIQQKDFIIKLCMCDACTLYFPHTQTYFITTTVRVHTKDAYKKNVTSHLCGTSSSYIYVMYAPHSTHAFFLCLRKLSRCKHCYNEVITVAPVESSPHRIFSPICSASAPYEKKIKTGKNI